MKPEQARARRLERERAKQIRSDELNAYLVSGRSLGVVVPELIPGEADLAGAFREYRHQARLAAGERGTKRNLLLDRAIVALAHVVYVERVLALDPLERAGLTPGRLRELSKVGQGDIWHRFQALQTQGESGVVQHGGR